MPKVSVIVPVYNVEKYLTECLDSIIGQSLREIEIICINDGSTDRCGWILEQYARADHRIRVVTQPNRGLSNARNTGIALAGGEYVGFVDSDDMILPDFYEKLYRAARQHDADIAVASIRRFFSGRFKLKYREEKRFTDLQARIDAADVPRSNYVWNKIYRRSTLNHPFPENRYYEDIQWTIRIVHAARSLVTVPGTAYLYRKLPWSIMQSKSEPKMDDCRKSWKELLDFAQEHRIRFKERHYMQRKTRLSLFGFTLLKGYHWSYKSYYKLFGFIPFIKMERNG
jgi:glycosyltransferase involved in cell wall biosynthesis